MGMRKTEDQSPVHGSDIARRTSLSLCACICLITYTAEFLESRPRRGHRQSWLPCRLDGRTSRRLMRLPLYAWSLCGISGFVRLFVKHDPPTTRQGCSTTFEVNPDIGSIGVHIALIATMAMTLITLVIGACGYRGETGTKELGVVMLVSKWKLLPPRNLTFTGVLIIGLLSSAKE